MAKNSKEASNNKKWRFYRSNLSTIVWDPAKDRPLADFTEGFFTTSSKSTASTLRNLGYVQIPLDAKEPPKDIIVNQSATVINGDVPLMSVATGEKLMEAKMKARTKVVGKPKPSKKPLAPGIKAKASKAKEANGKQTKSKLKRRKKMV